MTIPDEYSFSRYLAAKVSVDDRALNRRVWDSLADCLLALESPGAPPGGEERPVRVLEIGAGIGTMLERMLKREMLTYSRYTAIDLSPENIAMARQRLSTWAEQGGYCVESLPAGLFLRKGGIEVQLELEAIDCYDFLQREGGRRTWDLLLAHAFLDLVDIPATLPGLFKLLRPAGLFYFTINFDGLSALEPIIDPQLDDLILNLYHRTMDERIVDSKPSGDSRAGRHLFTHLRQVDAQILEAGASDWVVLPSEGSYPDDEAYFLHFIIHTIHLALSGHPQLPPRRFAHWVAERHAQVERGELVYMAHQIDFLGRRIN